MTELEKRLFKTIEASRKSALRYDKKIKELRAQVARACKHELTTEFNWEHDNGYGDITQMTGLHCTLCLKRKDWPRSSSPWY